MAEDENYGTISGSKKVFNKLVNYLERSKAVTQTIFTKKGKLYFTKEGVIALDLENCVGSIRNLDDKMPRKLAKIIGGIN